MARDRTERHLVWYLTHADVEVVKRRLPPEARRRLREIFFRNGSRGVRRLGSVRIRGRRDIELYPFLPPRVSLGAYIYKGQSPREFGAPARGQWPPWAVRRYLLYDVFLHELGHLRLVNPKSANWRRKFAGEKLAEEFADSWRRKLFTDEGFEHPDPIHFAPTEGELACLEIWENLDKPERYRLVTLALDAPYDRKQDLAFLGTLSAPQQGFLEHALYQGHLPQPEQLK